MNESADTRDTTPRPDPTVLTTAALNREISALKDYYEMRFKSERELSDEKFQASKESVAKSEEDANHKLEAQQKWIDDLRDRQNAGEGSSKGMRDVWGWAVAAVMALIAIAALAVKISN